MMSPDPRRSAEKGTQKRVTVLNNIVLEWDYDNVLSEEAK